MKREEINCNCICHEIGITIEHQEPCCEHYGQKKREPTKWEIIYMSALGVYSEFSSHHTRPPLVSDFAPILQRMYENYDQIKDELDN